MVNVKFNPQILLAHYNINSGEKDVGVFRLRSPIDRPVLGDLFFMTRIPIFQLFLCCLLHFLLLSFLFRIFE